MAVPTAMADLSTTAASNGPAGSDSPISSDDYHRSIQAILRHTNAKGADIASATTTDIGAATGEFVDVTGTTTITGLGTIAAGIERTVRFTGALTLTHNATSLILPTSANITTANGDVAIFRSLGSGNWKCVSYIRQDGGALALAPALRKQLASIQDFRLTLTSGTPVTTSDVTGATTIYASPITGTSISLYDGTNWNVRTSAEFSLALGTLTSGLPYDVFCYDNSGVPTLELLAWTNGTTRATALTRQDGVYVKSGATTRRYMGTFYTTSTTTTEDSLSNRYLWNYYHRVSRPMLRQETTATWTYTTATLRQANNSASNQLNFIVGVAEDKVSGKVSMACSNSDATGSTAVVAIGLDSTSARATNSVSAPGQPNNGRFAYMTAELNDYVTAGRHYYAWLEYSTAVGTVTWHGDRSATWPTVAGMVGEIRA